MTWFQVISDMKPETAERLAGWLSTKSVRDKRIFWCRLAGLSFRETGTIAGCSHVTVSGIVSGWQEELGDILL